MADPTGKRNPAPTPAPESGREPLTLSDRELWLIHCALEVYLTGLSHGEGALIHDTKALIQKFQEWRYPGSSQNRATLPQAKKLTL